MTNDEALRLFAELINDVEEGGGTEGWVAELELAYTHIEEALNEQD